MTHDEHTDNTPITDLTKDLALTLTKLPPQKGEDILTAQAQALDVLFTRVMDEKILGRLGNCDMFPDSVMKWMALAMRIQKQCNDTVKTQSAIDYMNGLTSKTAPPPPLPPKIQEQTE